MKHTMQNSWYQASIALFALVVSTTSLFAAQPPTPTTTFYLDSAGSSGTLGGVLTSPYFGQVNYPSSPIIPVICDDFMDESFVPEEWTAYVTSLSTLTAFANSSGMADTYLTFGDTNSVPNPNNLSVPLTQLQAYDAAAILAVEILNAAPGSQQQEDLSYALWGLFDSSAFGNISGNDLNNAKIDLSAAISKATSGNLSVLNNYNITFYSYDPPPSSSPGGTGMTPLCGSPLVQCAANGYKLPPQEFITVTTPEASTPLLLIVDLGAFLALVGFLLKRKVHNV